MPSPVTLAVVGAGGRGSSYSHIAAKSGRARIVAVAEPRRDRREKFALHHDIPADHVFDDWQSLAAHPKLADAVIVSTQDAMHAEPAVALAKLGYHILLEKPMATTEADCERIVDAAESSGVMLAVCHVLRYAAYTQALRQILDSGRIGDVVTVEHLEPVGFRHQAHSYVRGPWRREDQSSSMLMAKSCHDLDWLAYIIGRPARRVSSFGSLYHFRPEQRPAEAADRCLDCAVEPTCPYSALPVYLHPFFLTEEGSEERIRKELRETRLGQCVYDCDNDVVDHQVVALEYEGGVTASFTMTAFSTPSHRKSRIFGTHGQIESDGVRLTVHDFRTDTVEVIETGTTAGATAAEGHGGADGALISAFLDALETDDPSKILSGARESLKTHQVVWAAERARRSGTVVSLDSA